MADGAYDRAATYDAILARNPSARFIVPPCKGAVPGPTATISPTQRDLHVLAIDEHGRMNWQKASGYNKRSKVEAAISRYKRVIGDALKSRHDARRATEVAIAVKSLNRMNELGRAKFIRIGMIEAASTFKHASQKPPCNKVARRRGAWSRRYFSRGKCAVAGHRVVKRHGSYADVEFNRSRSRPDCDNSWRIAGRGWKSVGFIRRCAHAERAADLRID